jgi:hypothetical protein
MMPLKRTFRLYLSAGIFTLFGLAASAAVGAEHELTKICLAKSEEFKVHLIGSIHSDYKSADISNSLKKLISENTGSLYFEGDRLHPFDASTGESLDSKASLSASQNEPLIRLFRGYGFSESDARRLISRHQRNSTMFAYWLLNSFEMRGAALSGSTAAITPVTPGVEQLIRLAFPNVTIGDIENLPSLTPDRYLRRLEAASEFSVHLISRFDCVRCAIDYYKARLDRTNAFYANDLSALEKAEDRMHRALGSDKLFTAEVVDRNPAIIDTIVDIFSRKQERSIVVVLGAAHLIGSQGVPQLLKKNGFVDCY